MNEITHNETKSEQKQIQQIKQKQKYEWYEL